MCYKKLPKIVLSYLSDVSFLLDAHRFGSDLEISPKFEIVFVTQVSADLFATTTLAGLDTAMMTFVLHICGHFRVIRLRLLEIGRKISEDHEYSLPSKKDHHLYTVTKLRIEMSNVIEHHLFMIRYHFITH